MGKVSRNPARGFTLTELIVVIGILALLIAVALPVLTTTREKGRQAVCADNLHQLYLACAMYSSDSNGLIPMYDFWGGQPRLQTEV